MSELIRREDALNELSELHTICKETLPNENGNHYVTEAEVTKCYMRVKSITASPWHRVEEPPKENGAYAVCWKGSNSWGKLFYCGEWLATPGTPFPDYWMPIEPPKEDA